MQELSELSEREISHGSIDITRQLIMGEVVTREAANRESELL